jgi:hypothetical protein
LQGRLSSILGTTTAERKDIKKRFDELYDVRSKLVHGDEKHLLKTTEVVLVVWTKKRQSLDGAAGC